MALNLHSTLHVPVRGTSAPSTFDPPLDRPQLGDVTSRASGRIHNVAEDVAVQVSGCGGRECSVPSLPTDDAAAKAGMFTCVCAPRAWKDESRNYCDAEFGDAIWKEHRVRSRCPQAEQEHQKSEEMMHSEHYTFYHTALLIKQKLFSRTKIIILIHQITAN